MTFGTPRYGMTRLPVLRILGLVLRLRDPAALDPLVAVEPPGIHTMPGRASSGQVVLEGDTLRATGTFTVSTRDFGFEPFTAAMGAIRNADPLRS